ncbi:hypothetical protein A2U01_0036992 [Trifolium medium]|uniref:Uncharacterized protein n=1 Tax=Trifolium medium TaxID=97028 RepID=A0A392PUT3_9FABA|nr:hypothetical protein [Trifolium medium]
MISHQEGQKQEVSNQPGLTKTQFNTPTGSTGSSKKEGAYPTRKRNRRNQSFYLEIISKMKVSPYLPDTQ